MAGHSVDAIIKNIEKIFLYNNFLTEQEILDLFIVKNIAFLRKIRKDKTGPSCFKSDNGKYLYGKKELISWLKEFYLPTLCFKEKRRIYCKTIHTIRYIEVKETMKERYVKNKDKIKESGKEYRVKNKDKIKERKKEYYVKNKDKIKERMKEYDVKNKDKIKERMKEYRKEYYVKNKDKLNERMKEYYVKNKDKLNERKKEYRKLKKQLLSEIS